MKYLLIFSLVFISCQPVTLPETEIEINNPEVSEITIPDLSEALEDYFSIF